MRTELTLSETAEYDDLEHPVDQEWSFEVQTEKGEAVKQRFVQGGESYRTFDVPEHVEEEINEMGLEVVEP